MSQTTGISENLFIVGLIVAILASTVLSVGIATQLAVKGPKGDTGATGLQGPIGPQGPAGTSTSGTETNNQVQVSGAIRATQTGTITFWDGYSEATSDIKTSGPITNGQYSVLLVSGKSYSVKVIHSDGFDPNYYSLYVPTGVTTFTSDF